MKLATNIHHVSANCWKKFSRSDVKGQGHSEAKCTVWQPSTLEPSVRCAFGGGMQINCVTSTLPCFTFICMFHNAVHRISSDWQQNVCSLIVIITNRQTDGRRLHMQRMTVS